MRKPNFPNLLPGSPSNLSPGLEKTVKTAKTMKITRSQWVLAVLSGFALIWAFPKPSQGWLAWVALAPLLLALRSCSVKTAFIIGFGSGWVHYLGITYWTVHTMNKYGGLPLMVCVVLLLLLAAYMALYTALFAAALVWLCPRPWQLVLLAPAIWTALEFIRGWLFTGFPWELLGYSQYRSLWLIQFADLFGVHGVSALVVAVNASLSVAALAWLEKPWQQNVPSRLQTAGVVMVVAVVFVSAAAYGIVRINTLQQDLESAAQARVTVVQGNIEQGHKWDPSFQLLTAVKYKNLSLEAAARGSDLIIWPETATPFYFLQDELLSPLVIEGIKQAGTYFIIGTPSFARSGARPEAGHQDGSERKLYNSAYLMTAEGKAAGKYDKVRLVPYGEYVPLQRWMPFIDKLVAQVGDFERGRRGETLPWGSRKVGMLICYEAIFPELARAMVRNGADLLVNITNDAWFGRTSAAYQHFSMAVFRAVENRRPLARAANTGISGFVTPIGRPVATTSLFETTTATVDVPLLAVPGRYTQWGDWPLGSAAFVLVIGALGRAATHGLARRRV
jgi:apolipoprotein N-acyltransferase